MRSLITIGLAVLLGATADAACAPALAPGTALTGTATTAPLVEFFFVPTGTVGIAIGVSEIWHWNYGTPAALTRLDKGSATAWGLATLDLQGLTTEAIDGGVMDAANANLYISGGKVSFKLDVTASPYPVATIGGDQANAGCTYGDGTAGKYTTSAGMEFSSAAQDKLLIANNGCHTIVTTTVASPYSTAVALGSAGNAADTDGFGAAARLTNPRSLTHWKDRFYLTSAAGIRISVVKPNGGWWVGVVTTAAGSTTTTDVAFSAFGIVSAGGGIASTFSTWPDCSLVVWQDETVLGHIVDPTADITKLITGAASAYFAQQDPAGVVWTSDKAGGTKQVIPNVLSGCANYVSPSSCKWPTASATIPLPKTRTPTMPLPKTRTMTYVAPPTTVAATSAATSAAASSSSSSIQTVAQNPAGSPGNGPAGPAGPAGPGTPGGGGGTAAASASSTSSSATSAAGGTGTGSGASAVACAALGVVTAVLTML